MKSGNRARLGVEALEVQENPAATRRASEASASANALRHHATGGPPTNDVRTT